MALADKPDPKVWSKVMQFRRYHYTPDLGQVELGALPHALARALSGSPPGASQAPPTVACSPVRCSDAQGVSEGAGGLSEEDVS